MAAMTAVLRLLLLALALAWPCLGLPTSCRQWPSVGMSVNSGLNTLPVNLGGTVAYVLCDLSTHVDLPVAGSGGWTRVCRQKYTGSVTGPFPSVAAARNFNQSNPYNDVYSILDQIVNLRGTVTGAHHFMLNYPALTGGLQRMAWSQTDNPVTNTVGSSTRPVTGYSVISGTYNSDMSFWGGLEFNTGGQSLLDGSVMIGNWWYAVGSDNFYQGSPVGIPGPNDVVVQEMELWFRPASATADNLRPTVALSAPSPEVSTPDAFTVTLTAQFEAILHSSLAPADLTVVGGTAGAAWTTVTSGSVYTISVTPTGADSVIVISMAANAVTDASGNGNYASNVLRIGYKPALTSALAFDSAVPSRTSQTSFSATLSFSSVVSGVNAGRLSVTGPVSVTLTSLSTNHSCSQLTGSGKQLRTLSSPLGDVQVMCDFGSVSGFGGWTRVSRQAIDTLDGLSMAAPVGLDLSAHLQSPNDATAARYSIFPLLEQLRGSSSASFTFRLEAPARPLLYAQPGVQVWNQTSNPAVAGSVLGYSPVSVAYTTESWAGLQYAGGSPAWIDGSVDTGNWYYAVQAHTLWRNGIPLSEFIKAVPPQTFQTVGVQEMELWVRADAPSPQVGSRFALSITRTGDGPVSISLPAGQVTTPGGLGNSASATLSFTIDTTPPSFTAGPSVSVSGSTLTVSFTASEAGTVTCLQDSAAGTTTLTGGTSAVVTSPLSGSIVLSPVPDDTGRWVHCRIVDNSSPALSSAVAHVGPLRVDTAAPSFTAGPSVVVAGSTLTVSFTASEAATVTCLRTTSPTSASVAGGQSTSVSSPLSGSIAIASVPEGTGHYVHCQLTDTASPPVSSTIVSLGPYTVNALAPSFDSGPTLTRFSNFINVTFSVSEAATVTCLQDSSATTTDLTGGVSVSALASPFDGLVQLTDVPDDTGRWVHCRAVDTASSASAVVHLGPVKVDTVPPSFDLGPSATVSSSVLNVSFSVTEAATVTCLRDQVAGTSTVAGGTSLAVTTAPFSGFITFTVGDAADHYVHCQAEDSATPVLFSGVTHVGPLRVDTVPPLFDVAVAASVAGATVTVSFSSDEAATAVCVRTASTTVPTDWVTGAVAATVGGSSPFDGQAVFSGVPDGSSHYFHCRIGDTASPTLFASGYDGPVSVDTTAPGLSGVQITVVADLQITVSATSDEAGSTVRCRVRDAAATPTAFTLAQIRDNSPLVLSGTPPGLLSAATSVATIGNYAADCYAEDDSSPPVASAVQSSATVTLGSVATPTASATFNTIQLQWAEPPTPLGDSVTQYQVLLGAASDAEVAAPLQTATVPGAGPRQHRFIGLSENTQYRFRLVVDYATAADRSSAAGSATTGNPQNTPASPSGAAATVRAAAQAPAGGNALRQPAQNLTSLSGAPCLMDRCADGAFDVSCASRGGVHATQPRREWGWCGQLTLGKDISARDDASLCAALEAATGVPCSRFRFVSAAAGSIVYQMQLLPAPGVTCDPLQAGQIPDAVDFVDTTNAVQNGELRLDWDSNHHYESTEFDFVGASPACFAASFWSFEDVSAATPCGVRFTQRLPLTTALSQCGFSGPTPVLGSATNDVYYETTARVTTVQQLPSTVFGQAVNRTNQASQRLRVQLPGSVNLTTGPLSVFPAFENLTSDQANFAAITTQTFNTTANRATVRLVTSAAWPYVLTLQPGSPLTGGPSGFTKSASEISAVAITCDALSGAGQVCTQDWSLVFEANTATQCTLDGTYTVRFNVRCSLQFGNGDGCPALQNSVTSVVFDLRSDNFCARVVEVANVQPSLVAYSDAGRTSPLTDYPFLSTVFMRLALQTEAGLAVSFVELTDVELRSHCTGCTGASVYPLVASALSGGASAYSFAYTAAPGQAGAQHDFSFELNDASVQFDNNEPTGQVPLSVIAAVRVNYTDPAGQSAGSRVVRVESALPSRSLPASASVDIGATGPARGGSSGSAAGSSGTVTLASVAAAGAAVAVVVAVAAAVVGRRRRLARAKALARSSSAAELASSSLAGAAVTTDVLAEAVVVVDASSLQGVHQAYGNLS